MEENLKKYPYLWALERIKVKENLENSKRILLNIKNLLSESKFDGKLASVVAESLTFIDQLIMNANEAFSEQEVK